METNVSLWARLQAAVPRGVNISLPVFAAFAENAEMRETAKLEPARTGR